MLTQLIHWMRSIVDYRETGQGLVEYALIIMLISVVSIAILSVLGTSVSSVFSQANAAL